MRKNLIFLGVIAVFLVPFAVLADTGGSVQATLTLSAVINISVTDNWDDLTISQGDIAGWSAGQVIDWDPDDDDIVVEVKAITNFKVWAAYYASVDFSSAGDLLGLYDGTTIYWLKYYPISDPNNFTGDYDDLKDIHFTGSNNIHDGGASKSYEVKLKPENLGDRAAGETIDFTIVFVVEDPTT